MASFNTALDQFFDLFFLPLKGWPIEMGLAVVSAITAVALLLMFKLTSNQRRLESTRRQVYADLLEIRLFRDEPRVMLSSMVGIARHQATYLRLSLGPILWSALPMALFIAQLQAYFGYVGRMVNEPTLVTAQFDGAFDTNASLDAGPGIVVSTRDIRFPQLHQMVWRVIPKTAGEYVLKLRIGRAIYDKTLHVSNDGISRRSPRRERAGWFSALMAPSETPLDKSSVVSSITVEYADRRIAVFNRTMPWLVVYFIESAAFALLFKRPLRVTF